MKLDGQEHRLLTTFGSLVLAGVILALSACTTTSVYVSITPHSQVITPMIPVAPTLIKTVGPTETPTILVSPTFTATSTLEPSLAGPLIAFVASDAAANGYLLILDRNTGMTRRFQWGDEAPANVEWWSNGCGLNVTLATPSGAALVSVGLQSSKAENVFVGEKHLGDGFVAWPILSPDRKWVAYTVLSGKQQYIGAEFQNIEVIDVKNPAQPFVLTNRGGAWKAAWSPRGEYIAYSDYDSSGIAQVYRSRADGSDMVQLTHFTTRGTTIGAARWSPHNDKIVIAAYESDGTGSVWIIFADGSKPIKVKAAGTILKTDDFWWSENGQLFAFYVPKNSKQGIQDDAIYWINAANGNVEHALPATAMPGGYISQPFPVGGPEVIGFVRHDGFLFYDLASDTLSKRDYSDVELDDLTGPVVAAPVSFRGEASCRNQ
jgi:WD40 repeat protein